MLRTLQGLDIIDWVIVQVKQEEEKDDRAKSRIDLQVSIWLCTL